MPDFAEWLHRLVETAHLMVGLPDYSRYAAHRAQSHPGEPVMSRAEFVLERLNRRLAGGGTGRCC